jgi:YidC/Oxa1 family membrane protein insertase
MGAIIDFISEILLFLYQMSGNLGVAILLFTVLIRSVMWPLSMSSLRASNKMRELQPELKKLKEKHGKDAKALQAAQMDMYKRYNINPLAGCLPQLLQLGVLILLYQVLIRFLGQSEMNGTAIDPTFLWLNLAKSDSLYVMPLLAASTQMVLSLMIAPGAEKRDIVPNKSKIKSVKEANKKEENMADMAASMQQQMLFIMPVMTGFIALTFPSGLALYWVATTVFSIVQQWYVSGPGGLFTYTQRALLFIKGKRV